MRAILDSHPDVRCGTETKIIPALMTWIRHFRQCWTHSPKLTKEYADIGLKNSTINQALRKFILTILQNHGRPVKRLCTKDPEDASHIIHLKEIFPKMKFILMLRDVRGIAFSYVNRLKVKKVSEYEQIFRRWNQNASELIDLCKYVGPDNCMMIHYEHLILNKTFVLKKLMSYLDLRWSDNMLNHEKYIGDRVKISDSEWSASQIQKGMYTDAVNAWVGKIPDDVLSNLVETAPLLEKLGYDPFASNSYIRAET